MSWTVLDRVLRIAERTGHDAPHHWHDVRDDIRADVLAHGWDEQRGSFRQCYGSDAVDASLLLMPLMRFLPATDERVMQTVERIRRELERDGLVYRFDPEQTPGVESDVPLGEFEGAFLPCMFWLASVLAAMGRVVDAEQVLDRVERASPTGIFAEEMEPGTHRHLGNTPLLFSHAEHLRARIAVSSHAHALRAAQDHVPPAT